MARASSTSATASRAQYCIDVNAHALARYAALCQDEGHRADRRARGADGRRPLDRTLLRGHDRARCTRCSTELFAAAVCVEGMLLKPNMVIPGKKYEGGQGVARGDRRRDDPVLPGDRARRGARHRVPLRRPGRRGGHREPRRDEQARPAPVADLVLVRPRVAGRRRWRRGEGRTRTPERARRRTSTGRG